MKKVYQGIVEENVIRLRQKISLPVGTKTLVILKTMANEKQNEIKERQLRLFDKGFYLGERFYSKRVDLYAR
ncbi:MAG: hypothetical protein K8R79_12415 [Calditrichales bacterium]|nr:hypothetical protein [Calditrichales bacterium]